MTGDRLAAEFVWLWLVGAGLILVTLAAVTFGAQLAFKRGWRFRIASGVVFGLMLALVLWVRGM